MTITQEIEVATPTARKAYARYLNGQPATLCISCRQQAAVFMVRFENDPVPYTVCYGCRP